MIKEMDPICDIHNPPMPNKLFEKLDGMFEGLKIELRNIEA